MLHEVTTVRSVERALDALELVARNGRPMTLREISSLVRAPKSTTLNIVRTLVRRRVLELDPVTKTYRAGWALAGLAGSVRPAADLGELAKPHLGELAAATQETVLLAIQSGNEITFVEKIDSAQPIRYIAQIGTRRPLHCTASGKLHLALQGPARVDTYIAEVGLTAYTPSTITDPRRLRAELAQIRKRGYAVARGEFLPDLMGIAVPVWSQGCRELLAAVLVAGPAFRMRRQARHFLPLLRRAAEKIGADAARFGTAPGERPIPDAGPTRGRRP
jgi:DNA-binding IclR family transcriptional regulator